MASRRIAVHPLFGSSSPRPLGPEDKLFTAHETYIPNE